MPAPALGGEMSQPTDVLPKQVENSSPDAATLLVQSAESVPRIVDAFMVRRAIFPGPPRTYRLQLRERRLHIRARILPLRSSASGQLQTVLDFEHTSEAGCVLQLGPEANGRRDLTWICAGTPLITTIEVNAWAIVACGYDLAEGMSWMSCHGFRAEPVVRAPFPNWHVTASIGHWSAAGQFPQAGRDFRGEIAKLYVSGIRPPQLDELLGRSFAQQQTAIC